MRRVVIESPYAGDIPRNVEYARACMVDCLNRGEAPFASHLLYTQVLDDTSKVQRELGIAAGLSWVVDAEATVVYTDHGVSAGMDQGIKMARFLGHPIEYRTLPKP